MRYKIDPLILDEFEHYAKLWIPLVGKFGCTHHAYFLPSEGASDITLALFLFPSLATYEQYRSDSFKDEECTLAFKYTKDTGCVMS